MTGKSERSSPNVDSARGKRESSQRRVAKILRTFLFAVTLGAAIGFAYFLNLESIETVFWGIAAGIAGGIVFAFFASLWPSSIERFPFIVMPIVGFVGGVVFGFFMRADLVIMGIGGAIALVLVMYVERGVSSR